VYVRQQRDAVARGLSETAAVVGALVATEVETSIKSLETLATSQRLDNDDLAAFYEQERRVREHHQWSTTGLIDSTGGARGDELDDIRIRGNAVARGATRGVRRAESGKTRGPGPARVPAVLKVERTPRVALSHSSDGARRAWPPPGTTVMSLRR
jgi:hypothetical protein